MLRLSYLDPFARHLAFPTKLSREAVLELLRANSQPTIAAFRNSRKLFIGTVEREPIQLRHRQFVKRHDPRKYKLTMCLDGWVERTTTGNVLRFNGRPTAEFYGVPLIFLLIGAVLQVWQLAALAVLVVLGQTLTARMHLAEIEQEVRYLLDEAEAG